MPWVCENTLNLGLATIAIHLFTGLSEEDFEFVKSFAVTLSSFLIFDFLILQQDHEADAREESRKAKHIVETDRINCVHTLRIAFCTTYGTLTG